MTSSLEEKSMIGTGLLLKLSTIFSLTIFVFVSSFVILYILMQLSCFFKKHFCPPKNHFCQSISQNLFLMTLCKILNLAIYIISIIICGSLSMIMCEKCREGCTNHQLLVNRAIMFSVLTTIATIAGYLLN